MTTKEERNIERQILGNNQPEMSNNGYKGDNKGDIIETWRVRQPVENEALQRVGGDDKEELKTAATAMTRES